MKFSELDDAAVFTQRLDRIEELLKELKNSTEKINERMFEFQGRVYTMIVGVYALVVLQVLANHFWK